ncbi:hypothetical protein BDV3_004038 [Batrachochytrium dendrobatidis]
METRQLPTAEILLKTVYTELEHVDISPCTRHLFNQALFVMKQTQLARLQHNWAQVLVDHADDLINCTSFGKVSKSSRIAYMLACIVKAAVYSIQFKDHSDLVADITTCDIYNIRALLQSLDRGVLISGCPISNHLVLSWIVLTQQILTRLDPHSLLTAKPKYFLCSSQRIPAQVVYKTSQLIPAQCVEIHSTPLSMSEFNLHLTREILPTPIIICNVLDGCPCLSTRPWKDVAYILSVMGADRLVPVEIGSHYTDESWTQRIITAGEFFQYVVDTERQSDVDARPDEIMYLAQHDLFDRVSELASDLAIPDYCIMAPSVHSRTRWMSTLDSSMDEPQICVNVWIGPAGTHSPLHTDPYDNLFTQIVGYKYIRLYAPSETKYLYPHNSSTLLSNTSQVDVAHADLTLFPEFTKAVYVECIVGPGEMLLIPCGWWHYVESITSSISVSFWF